MNNEDSGYYTFEEKPPKITKDVNGDGYIFEGELHTTFYSYVVVHENVQASSKNHALDFAVRGIFSSEYIAEEAITTMKKIDKENGHLSTFKYKIFQVPIDHINVWSEYDCKHFPHAIGVGYNKSFFTKDDSGIVFVHDETTSSHRYDISGGE